jgi:hypothetical protein
VCELELLKSHDQNSTFASAVDSSTKSLIVVVDNLPNRYITIIIEVQILYFWLPVVCHKRQGTFLV